MNTRPFSMKAIKAFLSYWWTQAMTAPHVNSRIVFLGTFILSAALMLWHTGVYLHSAVRDPNYPTIMAVLAGGSVGGAVGRFFTKKGTSSDDKG